MSLHTFKGLGPQSTAINNPQCRAGCRIRRVCVCAGGHACACVVVTAWSGEQTLNSPTCRSFQRGTLISVLMINYLTAISVSATEAPGLFSFTIRHVQHQHVQSLYFNLLSEICLLVHLNGRGEGKANGLTTAICKFIVKSAMIKQASLLKFTLARLGVPPTRRRPKASIKLW